MEARRIADERGQSDVTCRHTGSGGAGAVGVDRLGGLATAFQGSGASARLEPAVLRALVEFALDGVVVLDADRRLRFANRAACLILRSSEGELLGQDFLAHVSPCCHPVMLDQLRRTLLGEAGAIDSALLLPNGQEREIVASTFAVPLDDGTGSALVFRDVTEERRAERQARALTQIASSLVFEESIEATLNALTRNVVDATGAIACVVQFLDEATQRMRVGGAYGLPDGFLPAWEALTRMDTTPVREMIERGSGVARALVEGRMVVVRGRRRQALADPFFAPMHDLFREVTWEDAVGVPLTYHDRRIGLLILYYPEDQFAGRVAEELFLRAVADQAAIAVENARLLDEARGKATLLERQRLARELHDSVTQALYGMTLYAEAALRTIPSGDLDTIEGYVRDLRDTAGDALREMRLLVFELRPPVLEREGLAAALQARLEAVEARSGLTTDLQVSGEGCLAPEIEQELYRIAQEALNNTLKHARARHVRVQLRRDPEGVVLAIADDGVGFDLTAADHSGGLGLRGMHERVARLGGRLMVQSEPGAGTRVQVEVTT